MVRCLIAAFCCLLFSSARADFDDSKVSLLPDVLPLLPGVSPLEQARAQALVTFLTSYRRLNQNQCDISRELCLPDYGSVADGLAALPNEPSPIMTRPIERPVLLGFQESTTGSTPTFGITYLAIGGDLIRAPFAGIVRLVQPLSAGRTQISIEHIAEDGGLTLSLITGQLDTNLIDGVSVIQGQAIARARPRNDGSTRVIYNLIVDSVEVDPDRWFLDELPLINTD